MDMDAFRDDDEEEADPYPPAAYRSDAYWRRRSITLALGLGLIAILVWAVTGGGGKPASPAPAGSQQPSLRPEAAYSAVPTAPPATQGSLKTPAARRAMRSPSADAAGDKGSKGAGGRCSPGALVLSVLAGQQSYAVGEDPRFQVYVVSTGSASCAFELGPAEVQVQVMSAGRIIWDSADCARAGSGRAVTLRRGVPAQESITWDRTVTLPGCVTLASSVRPGTYQVQVKAGTVTSGVLSIKLDR